MSAPVMVNVLVLPSHIVVLLAVAFSAGVLASAVILTVPMADTQPLRVLVTCTVNTPLPLATGSLLPVLSNVPVAGTVQL